MNYSWNWGVLFEHTGIGSELYIHWMITGLGWLLLITPVRDKPHCNSLILFTMLLPVPAEAYF